MDTRTWTERQAANERADRNVATMMLTKNQHNRLLQYEAVHGELTAREIKKKFNLYKEG